MHKAGGSPTDPVGIGIVEPFDPGDDEPTFGGVVGQIGRPKAPAPGQVSGLLEGEAVAAHQYLDPAIGAQADHHPNPRQEIADLLAHADAVGAFVGGRGLLEVVVEAVQAPNK